MPKTTRFEIRDIRPEGGFVLTTEYVKTSMPAEYATFMERLRQTQEECRRDYPALKATGRVFGEDSRLVKFMFLRAHPTKDITWVSLGTLEPAFSATEVMDKTLMISETPALAHATVRSNFCHALVWTCVLGATKIEPTGWADSKDNGDFRVKAQSKDDRRLCPRSAFPEMPVISEAPDYGGVVSWKRTSDKPVVFVVAWGATMICMHCETVASELSASNYKMCKRCRDSIRVPVWYCSDRCQKLDYGHHRMVCKNSFDVAVNKERCVQAAALGDTSVMCANCGIAPTSKTIHLFLTCPRCKRTGDTVMYCGFTCQRAHYSTHFVECKRRLFAYLEGNDCLKEILHRVELVPSDRLNEYDLHIYADLTSNPFVGEVGRNMTLGLLKELATKYARSGLAAVAAAAGVAEPPACGAV